MFPISAPPSVRQALEDPRWWRWPIYDDASTTVDSVPLGAIVERLRFVYDEDTVTSLISKGYWTFLLGLCSGQPAIESFGRMIALGTDLVAAPDVLDDSVLLRHLRLGQHFSGARLEVGCWAGLKRRGFTPRRPEWHGKNPDFLVDADGALIAIECKSLSDGNVVTNQHVFQEICENVAAIALMHNASPNEPVLVLSPEVHELFDLEPELFYSTIVPELETALRSALASATAGGEAHEVGRFGSVTLAPFDEGFNPVLRVEIEPDIEWRVVRIARTIKDAARQFEHVSNAAHRLVLVWTGDNYIRSSRLARLFEEQPGLFLPASIGIDAGVLLTLQERGFEPGWDTERGLFHVRRDKALPPTAVLEALADWKQHARLSR